MDCLIAGSGPSLDGVVWGTAPAFRIALTYAGRVVPDATVVAMLDYSEIALRSLPDFTAIEAANTILISTHTLNRCKVLGLSPPRDYVVIQPSGQSLLAAIHYAAQEGATNLVFVGVDGGMGNAASLAPAYTKTIVPSMESAYDRSIKRAVPIVRHYGMTFSGLPAWASEVEGEYVAPDHSACTLCNEERG